MRALKSIALLLLGAAALTPSGPTGFRAADSACGRNQKAQGVRVAQAALDSEAAQGETHPGTKPGETTKTKGGATVGFDVTALDRTTSPCEDFYQFACGTWMKNNPIPSDQATWGRFSELQERNRETLREILEQYSVSDSKRTPVEQKIGDYYASCMDEKGIDQLGVAALRPELDRIVGVRDQAAFVSEVIHLHRAGVGALFDFSSGQDFKDSSQVIAQADQGGLGLPDRDYYFKTDAKSVELRKQYQAHVQRMIELLGEPREKAKRDAQTVMAIETALAKGSLDRTSRRDPQKVYHRMTTQQLVTLDPAFSWPKYFQGVGAPTIESLNVAVPDFFKELEGLLKTTSLDDWKTYLKWHLVHSEAALLPTPFVNENFDFFGKTLTGAKEIRPRWKRCVSLADDELGEALGQKYAEKTFGAEGKARTLAMVQALEKALSQDINELAWMSPATKQQALVKLRAIANKIGYPDKWRDYSSVRIVRNDALGNSLRAVEFEFQRQLNKIGKPVDRAEWDVTPPTVNAYYNPQLNDINFPAGILQPPFFDNRIDDAVNFGAIGAVIGHELTHGFDDEGRQFDPQGNLRDWWTEEDAKEFEKRVSCVVDEYASFLAVDDIHLNGRLTLGENTADNGGLRIAYMALMATVADKQVPPIDGFTPGQRVFLGWGQIWCQNQTGEIVRMRTTTDPHSPPKYRVNGTVRNMPEFRKNFGCQDGQPMAPTKTCRVW